MKNVLNLFAKAGVFTVYDNTSISRIKSPILQIIADEIVIYSAGIKISVASDKISDICDMIDGYEARGDATIYHRAPSEVTARAALVNIAMNKYNSTRTLFEVYKYCCANGCDQLKLAAQEAVGTSIGGSLLSMMVMIEKGLYTGIDLNIYDKLVDVMTVMTMVDRHPCVAVDFTKGGPGYQAIPPSSAYLISDANPVGANAPSATDGYRSVIISLFKHYKEMRLDRELLLATDLKAVIDRTVMLMCTGYFTSAKFTKRYSAKSSSIRSVVDALLNKLGVLAQGQTAQQSIPDVGCIASIAARDHAQSIKKLTEMARSFGAGPGPIFGRSAMVPAGSMFAQGVPNMYPSQTDYRQLDKTFQDINSKVLVKKFGIGATVITNALNAVRPRDALTIVAILSNMADQIISSGQAVKMFTDEQIALIGSPDPVTFGQTILAKKDDAA